MNPDYVKKRLAELGLLLQQDQKLPSVVGLITGESLSRSWWDHPRGQEIFACLESLQDDAIATKLIGGKVTFVHRRLWPALYAVGNARALWQTKGLSPAARALLKKLPTRASGLAVKELEKRLLVRAQEVHTEAGRHEIEVTSWPKSRMNPAEGTRRLEEAAIALGATRRMLPWAQRIVLALLLFTSLPLTADEPKKSVARSVGDELKRYGADLGAMARAPLTWDETMWRRVGIITAADAAAFGLDQEIADAVQRNRSPATDEASNFFTPFGGRRGLGISAAVLLTGVVRKNPRLRESGRDAIEASVLAAGIVTPLLKRAVGRSRPDAGEGPYAFDPLGEKQSYPSGHVTNAFAIASVFAAHSDGWVVPTIAYTVASGVAAARVNDNAHYSSDVITGAVIGTAIGRSVVARRRGSGARRSTERVSWMLVPARGGLALEVSVPVAALTHLRVIRKSAAP